MGEGNAPRFNLSLFYVSYLTVKVLLSYTFNWKMIASLEIECTSILWNVTIKLTITGFSGNIIIHMSFLRGMSIEASIRLNIRLRA